MEDQMEINDLHLMLKDKVYKKREIQLMFWRIASKELDPHQGRKLENIPMVIEGKKDWSLY
jgi:hypothetical protein